ncbi:MAG: single-stranded DNA-binding protein [Myxococcota bacterium]
MRGMNKIFLVGRVGQDPDIRRSKLGRPWCPLQVATQRDGWEPDGSCVERTDWHEVQLVGQAADVAERWVRRGTIVAVEGTLTYDAWEDEHGHRHRQPTILASRIVVLGPRTPHEPNRYAQLPPVHQHRP